MGLVAACLCLLSVAGAVAAARPVIAADRTSIRAGPCSGLHSVSEQRGSVMIHSSGRLEFVEGVTETYAAAAVYIDSDHTASNFGKLRVATSGDFTDLQQLRAAGFVEGWLTAAKIHDHWHNLDYYFRTTLNASLEEPMQWLDEQHTWVMAQVATGSSDPLDTAAAAYWRSVGLAMEQWEGLLEGYQARAKADQSVPWLSRRDLLFLHSNGDLYDILDMFEARRTLAAATASNEATGTASAADGRQVLFPARLQSAKTPGQLFMELAGQGKCSALIKVLGDLSDIIIGHSTWDSYTSALRIFKHYELALHEPGAAPGAGRFSFSSYPGELFSDDDLWMTGSGLVVLETTNHIYDPSVFKVLTPHSVLSWQRVRAANLLATSGDEWVRIFSKHQSGTYNNQMMVLDLARFRPKQELLPGLLWVAEQLPGLIVSADMTESLMRGYWPSYNVPYFPEIYNASGIRDTSAKLADRGNAYTESARWLRYQSNPRANIMRRDQGDVASVAGMRTFMRSNRWFNDSYSAKSPMGAVCGRGDLAAESEALPKGCQDSKVTSYKLARRLEAEVVNGPTTQDGLPPFNWDDPRWAAFEHRGHPAVFNFRFERMSAKDLPLTAAECHNAAPQ